MNEPEQHPDPTYLFSNLGVAQDLYRNKLNLGTRVRVFENAAYLRGTLYGMQLTGHRASFYVGVIRGMGLIIDGRSCYRVDAEGWVHRGERRPIVPGVNDIIFPPVNAYREEQPSFQVEAYMKLREREETIGRFAAELAEIEAMAV